MQTLLSFVAFSCLIGVGLTLTCGGTYGNSNVYQPTFRCPESTIYTSDKYCCKYTYSKKEYCCSYSQYHNQVVDVVEDVNTAGIVIGVIFTVGFVIFIISLIICCCCACCPIYQRRTAGTVVRGPNQGVIVSTTTTTNPQQYPASQYPQQYPVTQGVVNQGFAQGPPAYNQAVNCAPAPPYTPQVQNTTLQTAAPTAEQSKMEQLSSPAYSPQAYPTGPAVNAPAPTYIPQTYPSGPATVSSPPEPFSSGNTAGPPSCDTSAPTTSGGDSAGNF